MKIAAVTMVYNEPDMLPIWLRYYGQEAGADQCYVIDHGSDDGSTLGLTCNVVKIPRSNFDDRLRAAYISDFCSSLLKWYDWVIYSDVDEILVPDANHYGSLTEYCAEVPIETVTAFGMNLIHRPDCEPPLDPRWPILSQRRWVLPVAAAAKPLLTRVPIRWTAGFHTADKPMEFARLLNFHLCHTDTDIALRRQAKRRSVCIPGAASDHHHKASDALLIEMMTSWANGQRHTDATLTTGCPRMGPFMQQILDSRTGREGEYYNMEMNIWNDAIWRVPDRFVGTF